MRLQLFVLLSLSAICMGCGRSSNDLCPVAGVVKYQNVLLENGVITFMTEHGQAGGAMIKRGRYDIPAEHGLTPGKYRVMISSLAPGKLVTPEEYAKGVPLSTSKETLPAEYNTKSTLTVEITPAKNAYDFVLR